MLKTIICLLCVVAFFHFGGFYLLLWLANLGLSILFVLFLMIAALIHFIF
jgi:hypothetical protein